MSPPRTRRCALVVDDDAIVRSGIEALMANAGMAVLQAGSAAEALRQSRRAPRIDVAVVDVELEDDDGIAVAERLRAEHPSSVVACISAATPSSGQRGRLAPFAFYTKDASLFEHLAALLIRTPPETGPPACRPPGAGGAWPTRAPHVPPNAGRVPPPASIPPPRRQVTGKGRTRSSTLLLMPLIRFAVRLSLLWRGVRRLLR